MTLSECLEQVLQISNEYLNQRIIVEKKYPIPKNAVIYSNPAYDEALDQLQEPLKNYLNTLNNNELNHIFYVFGFGRGFKDINEIKINFGENDRARYIYELGENLKEVSYCINNALKLKEQGKDFGFELDAVL